MDCVRPSSSSAPRAWVTVEPWAFTRVTNEGVLVRGHLSTQRQRAQVVSSVISWPLSLPLCTQQWSSLFMRMHHCTGARSHARAHNAFDRLSQFHSLSIPFTAQERGHDSPCPNTRKRRCGSTSSMARVGRCVTLVHTTTLTYRAAA